MGKSYKDLSPEEELELTLLLGFFQESVQNAYLQMERWSQQKRGWDLQMFFVAMMCVFEATTGLKRFLEHDDPEVWSILKRFRDKVDRQKIGELRNDIIHPKQISKLQDQKRKPLPKSSVLHIGSYHVDRDEYYFGKHKIRIPEAFDLVTQMIQELRTLTTSRLTDFYQNQTGAVEGMIPFTYLHHFPLREN